MKTLEQHDSELREVYKWSNEPHQNGIECPTCGKELWDSNPSSMLLSYPPKMNVHCPDCGYSRIGWPKRPQAGGAFQARLIRAVGGRVSQYSTCR